MNKDYDLELAVMCAITAKTGYQWTLDEIAAVCDITRQAVQNVEGRAKRAIWRNVHKDRELVKELNESRGLDGEDRFFLPGPKCRHYVSARTRSDSARRRDRRRKSRSPIREGKDT